MAEERGIHSAHYLVVGKDWSLAVTMDIEKVLSLGIVMVVKMVSDLDISTAHY